MHYIDFHRLILAAIFAMARIGGAFAICPALTESMIPGVVRRAMVLGISLLVVPSILNGMPPGEPNIWMFSLVAFKEALIGFLLGFFAYGTKRLFWRRKPRRRIPRRKRRRRQYQDH